MRGSRQDTTVYRRAVFDIKSKDHHLLEARVNLKLKFRKGSYLPVSCYVGRLQDDNLRETFQERLNTKTESLKLDYVEYGWNKFWKTIYEVANGVLGIKVKIAARNISEKALY